MDSNISTTPRSQPDPGLPPVIPPSGQAFLQLIAVPFLIVVGVVLFILVLWYLGGKMLGIPGSGDPQAYLHKLDDSNEEVRWRAASDLAQVLLRDEQLASDARFGLELAARLDKARRDAEQAEKEAATQLDSLSAAEGKAQRKKLEARRNLRMFLTACLGNVTVPVGVPVLKTLALDDSGAEWRELAQRRRQALWALANLGQNLQKYDDFSEERQDAIDSALEQAMADGLHSEWARQTLEYLERRREGKQNTMGVADTLVQCAQDREYMAVREMAAYAMNFWWGSAEEDARLEEALVQLSHDNGDGEERLDQLRDEDLQGNAQQSRSRVKRPGFEVQANATIALARRGSPQVRLDLLELMLDLDRLGKIQVLVNRDGSEQPDQVTAIQTVLHTLKAVELLHKRRPEMDLDRLRPAIDQLTQHDNEALRTQARATQLAWSKE
jgi:hypothetical protein